MKLGIDLDGCVYNFDEALRRHAIDWHGKTREQLPEPTQWNYSEDWGMEAEEWQNMFREAISAGVFRNGPTYPGAIGALYELKEMGHTLHIVTHRFGHAVPDTWHWLNQNNVPYDSLTFARDKTIVPVDLFIEDKTQNATDIIEASGRAVLIDRLYNRDAPPWVERVSSWTEFVELVKCTT